MSETALGRAKFRKGQRVVVMNPGPMSRGVVAEDQSGHMAYVNVEWDDGTKGSPRVDLLALERTDDEIKQIRSTHTIETDSIKLGHSYYLQVESHCGIVRIVSTRDGCMFAVGPNEAREIATQLSAALNEAADLTEIRSYGYVMPRT